MAANVHESPLFNNSLFQSIHFVISQNNSKDLELRIDLSGNKNHKIFDYSANSNSQTSKELIGISSASSSVLSSTNKLKDLLSEISLNNPDASI
jgi:hypothetical protein